MVKSRLTVSVERSVTEESNWTQLGDLASGILRMAAERREKLNTLKAAVARDHADALQQASGGIWVQLDLPLPMTPPRPHRECRVARASRAVALGKGS